MFAPEDILERLKRRPFVPMRIVTTTGTHEIHHPDLVLVGRRFIEIGKASRENPETFDSITQVAILHITSLENINTPPKRKGNGRARE
ncbi:MAG TPA: hypothetical protein VGH32_04740 [Pirellulales bacterium]